jgi:hypothetical protein
MPSHARKQIRDAVKATLLGLSVTGSRVYIGRARPLGENHPPTILIYSPLETARRENQDGELERLLSLFVEIRLVSTDAPDDALDAIALDVEAAMAADRRLGGLLTDMQLIGTEQAVERGEQQQGGRIAGGLRLEYRATYSTLEGHPSVLTSNAQ